MDAAFRRKLADDAIAAVLAGAVPRDLEREMLDFKEEAGTVGGDGVRHPISPRNEAAAQAVAGGGGCFKNSEDGGMLVVGVRDRAIGSEAFVETYLDVGWLRGRIHALTQPNVSIDPPEVLAVEGRRIYL